MKWPKEKIWTCHIIRPPMYTFIDMPTIFLLFSFAVFGCWHPASPGQQEPVPESRGIHFCCPQPVHWYHPNFHLHPVYCGTLPGIKVQLLDNRMGKQSPHLFVMVKFPFALPLVIFPSSFLFSLLLYPASHQQNGLPQSFFLLKGGLPATAACWGSVSGFL